MDDSSDFARSSGYQLQIQGNHKRSKTGTEKLQLFSNKGKETNHRSFIMDHFEKPEARYLTRNSQASSYAEYNTSNPETSKNQSKPRKTTMIYQNVPSVEPYNYSFTQGKSRAKDPISLLIKGNFISNTRPSISSKAFDKGPLTPVSQSTQMRARFSEKRKTDQQIKSSHVMTPVERERDSSVNIIQVPNTVLSEMASQQERAFLHEYTTKYEKIIRRLCKEVKDLRQENASLNEKARQIPIYQKRLVDEMVERVYR